MSATTACSMNCDSSMAAHMVRDSGALNLVCEEQSNMYKERSGDIQTQLHAANTYEYYLLSDALGDKFSVN